MPIEGQNEIGTRAKIVVAEASVSMRHYVSVRLFGWYHFLSIHVSIDFFFPITTPSLIEGKNAIGAGAKIEGSGSLVHVHSSLQLHSPAILFPPANKMLKSRNVRKRGRLLFGKEETFLSACCPTVRIRAW